MNVLVAYASAHGSTRGIAGRIAEKLHAHGLDATLYDVIANGPAPEFHAAIIGSAIHNARWLPEATEFLGHNEHTLASLPLWLFSVSSAGDEGSFFPKRVANMMRKARKSLDETTRKPDGLAIRGHRNFAGAIERGHYPLAGHLFMKAMGGRYGDHATGPRSTRGRHRSPANLR